ncbi:MAG: MgtC/SapB family protein [Chloroflexia bacterium]|nr:MgtC/SapB family protein [Chloroflexia bacterium]
MTDLEALGRMGVAMAVGAALGLERELLRKSAGIRTLMLVCEGAALFMICSVLLAEQVVAAGGIADPTRIASTVVQGIGFLAGGLIFTARERVRGLTTAAEVWVAAALGLLIGAGFLAIALGAAAATLVALVVLRALQGVLPFSRKNLDPEARGDDE